MISKRGTLLGLILTVATLLVLAFAFWPSPPLGSASYQDLMQHNEEPVQKSNIPLISKKGNGVKVHLNLYADDPNVSARLGSLFTAYYDGKPLFGAGFKNNINTSVVTNANTLNFFINLPDHAVDTRIESLGRPFSEKNHIKITNLDNKVIAYDRTQQEAPRYYDESTGAWEQLLINGEALSPTTLNVFKTLEGYLILDQGGQDGVGPSITWGNEKIEFNTHAAEIIWGEQNHFFIFDKPNRVLYACDAGEQLERLQGDFSGCVSAEMTPKDSTIYTYLQLADRVIFYTNTGSIYQYSYITGRIESNRLNEKYVLSNQYYTSYLFEDKRLLGHYPSGGIFNYTEGVYYNISQPVELFRHMELQTLTFHGGFLFAGFWPWGEIKFTDNLNGPWCDYARPFKNPERNELLAPYYNLLQENTSDTEMDPDALGQRVTSLVSMGSYLYFSTADKAAAEYTMQYLTEEDALQYGAVYRAEPAYHLACDISLKGDSYLDFRIRSSEVLIFQNGELVCTGAMDRKTLQGLISLLEDAEFQVGKGPFGPYQGDYLQQVCVRSFSNRKPE